MFGLDWSNPETLWLNLTNVALGLVILAVVLIMASGIVVDLVRQRAARRQAEAGDVAELLGGSHSFYDPHLGLTMADGGEPETEKPKATKKDAKPRRQA
jgi:hypothetical protein